MRLTNTSRVLLLGTLLTIGLLGGRDGWGQSGRINVEVNVYSVQARKSARSEPNNEFRYNIYFDGSTYKLQLEQKANESDLPASKSFDATINRYFTYNSASPIKLWVDAWEEDCGGDNEYNSGCYVAGIEVGQDNRRSLTSHDIAYQAKEPGKWHDMYLEGNGMYGVYAKFRWSPPQPPAPSKVAGPICKNEDAVQFTVPSHPQKQHVTQWQWQRGTMTRVKTYPTPSACYAECGSSYTYGTAEYQACVDNCLTRTPVYEDYFSVNKAYSGTDKFSYKNNGEGLTVRYRQKYAESVYSPWSDPATESSNFYTVFVPKNLITQPNGEKTDVTNLYCGSSTINLTAEHPVANGSWADHTFDWYRKVGSADYEKIVGENNATLSDSEFATFPGQRLQYKVEVNRVGCSTKYTKYSNSLFFFEEVPDLEVVIDETRDTKQASCENSKDGELTIRATSANPNLRYYYNIGLLDAEGHVERTEIISSGRVPANTDYTFTGLLPGDYKVQVIHSGYSNGKGGANAPPADDMPSAGYCADEHTITVGFREPFTIRSHTVANVSCHGKDDGSVRIPFRHQEGDLSMVLKNVRTGSVVNVSEYTTTVTAHQLTVGGLPQGEYRYEISDSRRCQTLSKEVTITQPEPLAFTTETSNYRGAFISCRDAEDAFIRVIATGGNRTGLYSVSLFENGVFKQKIENFTTTTAFTEVGPGTYTINVIAEGCGGLSKDLVTPVVITQPEHLAIDSIRTDPITCYGVANGEITVKASGGTGTRQFRVDSGPWQATVDEHEEFQFIGLDSGEHIVEVKDINGCTAPELFRFRLEYPTPLSFNLDSLVMPSCHDGADGKLFIRPSGGDPHTQGYEVSLTSPQKSHGFRTPSPSTGLVEFEALSSGDYTITLKDSNTGRYTCTVDSAIFLPQPTLVTVNTVQFTLPSCAGATDGSVSVRADGGTPDENPAYYYSIDGENYVAPNAEGIAEFDSLAAGTYTFYAIDGHHDYYEAGHSTLYVDPSLQLCTGTFSFTLDEPELITVYTSVHPTTCYGTATGGITVDEVTGGRGDYTYEWEVFDAARNAYRAMTPANPQALAELAYGNYRLTVRDVAGCQAVVTTEVTQPEVPLAIDAVLQYPESCAGTADGRLQLSVTGGWPGYTYRIDDGAFEYNNGFFAGLTAGAYMLTVRDRSGCEVRQMVNLGTDELTVTLSDQLPATVGFNDGLLRLYVTGGQNKQYFLDGALSSTGSEFSGLAAGVHTVVIEYNGQCRWEQAYTIDEEAAPMPALRVVTKSLQNVRCSDAQDGSVRVAVSGGVPPYILQWNDAALQTTATRTNLAKGSYSLTVTDATGATLDYRAVIDGPKPFEIINSAVVSPACYQGVDGYAEVTATGGTAPYTYRWDDDNQQTTARASQLMAGTYTVTITDHNGCQLAQALTVAPTPAPVDVLEPQAITLCTGQSVTVDAGATWSTYQWTSDHDFSSTEQSIVIDRAGRYFLRVTNDRGCPAYDTLNLVTTDNLIDAEFLLPTEIFAGDTVVLTEVSWPAPEQAIWLYEETVTTYRSDGEKEYVIFPEPGEYTIKLVVLVGSCMDEVEKKIIVSEASAKEPLVKNGRLGYAPKSEYVLYPNPNHGKFTLKVRASEAGDLRVSVYDPLFKYRYYRQTFANTASLEEEMDLTKLKHGVYSLMVETPDEIKIMRFVIR